MTMVDGSWRAAAYFGEGMTYGIYLIQKMTGGPTPNTLVPPLLIYGLVICGLSSARGLAFLAWRVSLLIGRPI